MRPIIDRNNQSQADPDSIDDPTCSRRAFLKTSTAACVGLSLGFPCLTEASLRPIAQTTAGAVAGTVDSDIYVFKGIRYGADTAGKRRFMPPEKPEPWQGVKSANSYGPACPQSRPGSGSNMPEGESEDCLTLNVWSPGLRDNARRPVMVWLHGGGLWRLSAAGDDQAGGNLAARGDVVMVSPNHRLGVFGFAYLENFDGMYKGSSLVGMLDLVLALEWVRDNIEEFGGDPDNVTIFGQSGGGQKVSLLMAMPSAKGLFHKAIIQSGPAPLTLEPPYAKWLSGQLIDKLGIAENEVAGIQQVSGEFILDKYYEIFDEIGGFGVLGVTQDFAPVVDGALLPQQPFWNDAPPVSADIPLMIGSTRTEMTGYVLAGDPDAYKMDFDIALKKLNPIFGAHSDAVLEHYRSRHSGTSAWEVYSLILSDWPTRLYSLRTAEVKARQSGAQVYVYRTDWETEAEGGVLMSPHAVDIQFVLGTIEATPPFNDKQLDERRAMAELMMSAWVSFARHGQPRVTEGPEWLPYTPQYKHTFRFDLPPGATTNPDEEDIEFLKSILPDLRTVAKLDS